jgi:predicted phage terminase large subunit-like protein
MQRVHERDLTGELLARDLGYEHLMIPMEFEPERRCVTSIGWEDPRTFDGELMDPVRFPRAAVDLLKKDNDYMWAGQYQQRPAPREGGMFKVEKITGEDNNLLVDFVPAGAVRVRGWDIAGSTRKKSPFTVGAKLAYHAGIVYIENVERARAEIDKAEKLIVDTAHHDGISVKQSIPQDPGQAGKGQKFHLANRLAGLDFMFSPETGEKADRAIPFASMVNAGSVRMVKGPWNGALIDEMRNFPASTYKDQIDALSRAFSELVKSMGTEDRVVAAPMFDDSEEDALPYAIND